jgi:phytoene dehydrogenase-like protein
MLGSDASKLPRNGAGRPNGVSCKINMAVSMLPDFTALPGTDPGPQHLGTVHLSPSMEYLEQAWENASVGRPSSEPMIEMYIQTATDRSLAPEGKHILSCFTQYFPYLLADGLDHGVEAEKYYRRVLDIISRYAPNVTGSVEEYQVLTSRDLESRFGLTGGHIFHGDITPDQMFGGRFGSNGPETHIPGLYMCGSGAYPGGCVSGVPGFNAAWRLMEMRRWGNGEMNTE